MSKITRNYLVAAVVLPALFNLSAGAERQEPETQEKVENPYEGAWVLVEALIVEVKLDALEKAGAGPLSKEPPSAIRILEIIKDKNAGGVKTTAKLALSSFGEGHMQANSQVDVPMSRDPNSKATIWRPYNVGIAINANLEIDPDGRILMKFKMDLTALVNDSKVEGQSPDVLHYAWDSTVSLKSGTPIIASGLGHKDKMTYLILRADIEQDSLPRMAHQKK